MLAGLGLCASPLVVADGSAHGCDSPQHISPMQQPLCLELPELGSHERPVMNGRSRLDLMARRFKHEGLPVARLWENDSMRLAIGLNPQGRAGLWLVRKFP